MTAVTAYIHLLLSIYKLFSIHYFKLYNNSMKFTEQMIISILYMMNIKLQNIKRIDQVYMLIENIELKPM
jgi:hypothetical protein